MLDSEGKDERGEKCTHHWVIERPEPEKKTSEGVCKFCGARKELDNFLPPVDFYRAYRRKR